MWVGRRRIRERTARGAISNIPGMWRKRRHVALWEWSVTSLVLICDDVCMEKGVGAWWACVG